MKKSILSIILATISFNASAELKASNVDGWELSYVKEDKLLQYAVPGAEYVLTKKKKEGVEDEGMAITIRKIDKLVDTALSNDKKAWMNAMYTSERQRKTRTSAERQAVLKVDGQWRFISEQDYNTGLETPLSEAVMGMMIDEDLYLVQYQNRGGVFQRNKKEAIQILKKVRLEEVGKEAAAKSK